MPVATGPSHLGVVTAQMKTFATIPASEPVHCLAFSPFEWCANLVAFGGKRSIVVGEVKCGDEGESEKAIEFNRLSEFHHDGRVEVIAWSPESSLLIYPRIVKFAVASGNKKLKIIHSDLEDTNRCTYLEGHKDYVNAIAFLENGQQLASTGDDLTARVWSLKEEADEDGVTPEVVAVFPLGSPGVALGWHSEDPAKLMVAERAGVVRFYNVSNQQTIMSLDTLATRGLLDRLSSADLCPGNPLLVAAITQTGSRLVWDVSRSSQPLENWPAHPEGGGSCLFSVAKPHLLASTSQDGNQIRVFNIQTNSTVFASSCPGSRGLSWHARLPLVAIGGDKKILLWKTEA